MGHSHAIYNPANVEPIDVGVDADIIGLTGYVVHELRMFELAAEFRRRGKFVVASGPLTSLSPEELRDSSETEIAETAIVSRLPLENSATLTPCLPRCALIPARPWLARLLRQGGRALQASRCCDRSWTRRLRSGCATSSSRLTKSTRLKWPPSPER
jgi:hypothetical protein